MTKTLITKTWIGGLVVLVAGIVAATIGVFLMLAFGGTFTPLPGDNNYHFTPDLNGRFFWTTVAIMVVAGVVMLIGGIVQLVAWFGALVNSYWLPDKTWFVVLLLGGLLSLAVAPAGFAVMVAYLIAAPDGAPHRQVRATAAPQPGPLAPAT